jgi:hypothetical protein
MPRAARRETGRALTALYADHAGALLRYAMHLCMATNARDAPTVAGGAATGASETGRVIWHWGKQRDRALSARNVRDKWWWA